MNTPSIVNRIWLAWNHRKWRTFRRAILRPGESQRFILNQLIAQGATTAFGRSHNLTKVGSVKEFQSHVPIGSYESHEPWIHRAARGERDCLFPGPVERLVPTSGSTGACKFIPYNKVLQNQFNRAIGPWVVDLFGRYPRLKDGPAYWSVSPAMASPSLEGATVPTGFEDDSAYVGGTLGRWIARALAVPSNVRLARPMAWFNYLTLLHLLRAGNLRLISIWHPSFLSRLLEPLDEWWPALLNDIECGTLEPPFEIDQETQGHIFDPMHANRRRAKELQAIGPDPKRLWPQLEVISLWADAHARKPSEALAATFEGVEQQAKGIIATEAFVSLPFAGKTPLAICSHFFEFLADDGKVSVGDEVEDGGEYEVVVTTGGGLYRYRMGDRVRINGRVGRTPSLELLGRSDRVSDRCGEKLNETFVADCLAEGSLKSCGVRFAMMAPDRNDHKVGYTLFVESEKVVAPSVIEQVESALQANPHYRYCVELGQLRPLRGFQIRCRGHHVFLERAAADGQVLGTIKASALSSKDGWSECFEGAYVVTAKK